MYLIIRLCFVYVLFMLSGSMKVIKIDRNVSELGKIVCNNIT